MADRSVPTPHAASRPRPHAIAALLLRVFPPLFVLLYLTHLPLLRLPYIWDEAGYYIPAAHDLLTTGTLIPRSTLSNAHPPLPSLYLALWWKLSGYMPAVTRVAMLLLAALSMAAVLQLARSVSNTRVAVATTLLTLAYPVWFSQSVLAHADLPAACCTLWALALYCDPRRRRLWPVALLLALAALSKETAIVYAFALSLRELLFLRGAPSSRKRRHWRDALLLLTPVLPLAAWYAWHWHGTGHVFGNPEYLRYNATATLSPLRVALAFAQRVWHVTGYLDLFVPVLLMFAAMLLPPLKDRDAKGHAVERPRIAVPTQVTFLVVIVVNLVFFSFFGGALLTRYLLPLYPLVLLEAVATFWRRVRWWPAVVLLSLVAFVSALLVNPPYRFAPEDNLAWRDMVLLHVHAARMLEARFPTAVILTAWPGTDELTKPELGYVRRPLAVAPIENFSAAQVERAARDPGAYSAAFVFSTKFEPARPLLRLPFWERVHERFFGYHRDLSPAAIAGMLGGTTVWDGDRRGEWAAVLAFNRVQSAALGAPAAPAPARRPRPASEP